MSIDNAIHVATDIGGTFTDLVCFYTDKDTGRGHIVTAKTDSTPPNFEQGVLNVIRKAEVQAADIAFHVHGTTVVINALAERKGAKVGFITTLGFRDSIEIARGNRPDFFNLSYRKPEPFVPRHLRRELPGRLAPDGSEREPLELSTLPAILDDFRREGVQAVAICLLNSYANAAHEKQVLDEVLRLWPEVSAVASHQIIREWREYERSSTTVLSAYVQPIAARYLADLKHGLREDGFNGSFYVMQSNCGVDSIEHAREIPITMIESGPASGFWGAAELGRLIGEPNVLAIDIGGTTAKCSLIENNQVKILTDYWIERNEKSAGYPIMVPVVDLVEIGNGGGSIGWLDELGKLHVGPQSAGSIPGPAAYGNGGTQATTTDANLLLRRINPGFFCGGAIAADLPAVDRAFAELAAGLDMTPKEVARGIVRIANNNMVNALKLVSMNRGHDPRDFALVAFGGGGPMHAVALATELNIRKVVIPYAADVFSAWGMLMCELRRDYFVTRVASLEASQAPHMEQWLGEMTATALQQLAAEGFDRQQVRFLRYAKLRYENQEHHVEVALPDGAFDASGMRQLVDAFHVAYEHEYTYRLDAAVELVGLHLVALVDVGKLNPAKLPVTGRALAAARKAPREVDYDMQGVHEAAIYDGALLEPGMNFAGPAVVETSGTTVLIHPGNRVSVDDYGNLHIEISGVAA